MVVRRESVVFRFVANQHNSFSLLQQPPHGELHEAHACSTNTKLLEMRDVAWLLIVISSGENFFAGRAQQQRVFEL
jgi:L-asparaginase II